jgi:hypothetical protein
MADQKLTDLPAATTVANADKLYVVQGVSSKSATVEVLRGQIPNTPTAIFGDGSSTLSLEVGQKCYVRVPYGGTIVEWGLVANATCSCTIDVWAAAGALPTSSDSVTGGDKPALSGATVAGDSTLVGWSPSISAGDVLGFSLDTLSGSATQITLTLKVK